jgi:hypothetical protein
LSQKNANFFAEFFGKNIFKNHNIGPRWAHENDGTVTYTKKK